MDAQNNEPVSPFEAAMKRLEQVKEMKKDGVLVKEVDYGDIPGANKPSLLKPGAQKLMAAFDLSSVIKETVKEVYEEEIYGDRKRVVSYRVTVALQHKMSGMPEGEGVGVCNTAENKYLKRRPADMENTVLKMAKKRALVDAVLDATGAGSIFTQDVEDMDLGQRNAPQRPQQDTQTQQRPQPTNGNNRPAAANGAQSGQAQKPAKLTAMQELMQQCERLKYCVDGEGKAVVKHIQNVLESEGHPIAVTPENLKTAWAAIKAHYEAKSVPADTAAAPNDTLFDDAAAQHAQGYAERS